MYAGVIDKNIIGCVKGTIIQALFKEYSKTIVINGNNEICDVGKIIDRLNMKVEMENTQV